MEPIVYIPHLKTTMLRMAQLSIAAVAFWLLICQTDSPLFFGALGTLLLLSVYYLLASFTFKTFLVLDWSGIHVMHTKRGELLVVPWSQIKCEKFYPGVYDSPSVCVLFQSMDCCIDGKYLYSMDGPIDLKREGKKLLCDRQLFRLSREKVSLDAFGRMECIGITATQKQFSCIKAWRTQNSDMEEQK